jgi:hypothetical protein
MDNVVELSPVNHPEAVKRRSKSKVTNGTSLFVEQDSRGPWTRRFRDVFNQMISDLGSPEIQLSEGQRQLARRATTLSIACEKMEGEAAAGHDFDVALFGVLTDRLGRTLQRIGLKRVLAHDTTPNLEDMIGDDND